MTLTEFLLARITEDEEHAEGYLDVDWAERLLAECEAKRRIVQVMNTYAMISGRGAMRDGVFVAMPRRYADHPDYREEWA